MVASNEPRDICVVSPDTDVYTMLVDLVGNDRLPPRHSLTLMTKGKRQSVINIRDNVLRLGKQKSKALLGLHNFTGSDWGGKMVGISKDTWIKKFLDLDENSPVIKALAFLGEGDIPNTLSGDELPAVLKPLENFTCKGYSDTSTSPDTVPSLRWHLFRSKNFEGENLPPTRAALLPHIVRVNYICMRDKSYTVNCPNLPPIEDNCWKLVNGSYMPVMCLELPAPKAVMELTKCGCAKGCSSRCSCVRNSLPCIPLCKCFYINCDNPHAEHRMTENTEEDL